jgi:hypothetical protein
MKKKRVTGVIMQYTHQLLTWGQNHMLPAKRDGVADFTTYVVPMDFNVYRATDCVCLTMHTQIDWIGQLALNLAGKFVMHVDGKHKLHHGAWVLVTVGTHTLEYEPKKKKIVHQFRPCVYMFCKQIETGESLQVAFAAADVISVTFFGVKLQPGIGCSDHGKGERQAWEVAFPDIRLMGCWPHVAWGLAYGKLLSKTHPLFDSVNTDFHLLHRAMSDGMWDVFVWALGNKWGDDDRELNALWHGRLCHPNNNWYLGFCDIPGSTPSQQAQESWHLHGIMSRLAGELRASTSYVLEVSLAKVMALDGALMPEMLNFEIPTAWIPQEMLHKALNIVRNQKTQVRMGCTCHDTRIQLHCVSARIRLY